jgi:hypothetical protein
MELPNTVRQKDALFPSSKMRLDYIEGFGKSDNARKFVKLGVSWCLELCNAYSIKQYSLRDHAVDAIKKGDIELALQFLEEIGK